MPSKDPSSDNQKLLQNQSDEIPTSDITAEKSLTKILLLSLKLPKNKFNVIATATLFIILLLYVIVTPQPVDKLAHDVYQWASLGFSFSASILGFLVAGFAIFSAVNEPKLFTSMARFRHESGLSYLKYNFIALMYVFIVYFCLALICFLTQIFGTYDGPVATLIITLFNYFNLDYFSWVKVIATKFALVSIGVTFFYSIMLLPSFIFNIYHITMTTVRLRAEEEEDERNNSR